MSSTLWRPLAGRVLFESGMPRSGVAWIVCGLSTVVLVAVMLALTPGEGWHRATVVCFALVAPLLVWIDLAEHRLPDLITLPLLPGLIILTVAAGLVVREPGRIGAALAGAAVIAVLFTVLFLLSPSSLGLGDVKLGPSVGLLLGWHGWQVVVLGAIAILVLGCVHGLVQVVRTRRVTGVDVAFGPAMVMSPLLVCALVSGA